MLNIVVLHQIHKVLYEIIFHNINITHNNIINNIENFPMIKLLNCFDEQYYIFKPFLNNIILRVFH